MTRALTLAQRGIGRVAPNPPVGAVIVYNDRVIGEGYHQQYGKAHAEVHAVESVSRDNRSLLSESTIYVTLEPCSFHGNTPPCVDLILKHQFKRVVIATQDPHPRVSGHSVDKLQKAGIQVSSGVLQEAALELIHAFRSQYVHHRPYYILKWAQTQSGHIGTRARPIRISNESTRRLSHKWRSEIPGILIGVGTALIDRPSLNDRYHGGPDPRPIIYDPTNQLPLDHALLSDHRSIHANREALFSDHKPSDHLLSGLNSLLLSQGINEVLVEGGRSTLQTFIDAEMWDEARIFTAPDVDVPLDVSAPIIQNPHRVSRTRIGTNFLDVLTPEP